MACNQWIGPNMRVAFSSATVLLTVCTDFFKKTYLAQIFPSVSCLKYLTHAYTFLGSDKQRLATILMHQNDLTADTYFPCRPSSCRQGVKFLFFFGQFLFFPSFFFFTRKPIFPIFSCWSKLDTDLASIFRLLCCLLLQFGLHLF